MVLLKFKVLALERRVLEVKEDGSSDGEVPLVFTPFGEGGTLLPVAVNDADEISIGYQGSFFKWRPITSLYLREVGLDYFLLGDMLSFELKFTNGDGIISNSDSRPCWARLIRVDANERITDIVRTAAPSKLLDSSPPRGGQGIACQLDN